MTAFVAALTSCGGGGGGSSSASSTSSTSAGPTTPPATLWAPTAGSTPSTGNYVYLQSDPGVAIANGGTVTYTRANAYVTVSATKGLLTVNVYGDQNWTANFQAMSSLPQLQAGYYPNATQYSSQGSSSGSSLYWSGDGNTCTSVTGWFVIDQLTYNGSNLSSIDLRFEQHCNGATPALHGAIHWNVVDTAPVPAFPTPVNPIPAGLWQPAANSTPSSGNYVYLQGQQGDPIIGANTYTYTQVDSAIQLYGATQASLGVEIYGNQSWNGSFYAMVGVNRLRVGYYPNAISGPTSSSGAPALTWNGNSATCGTASGWFAVDDISYDAEDHLVSIDLRFEQQCSSATGAAYGKIHWQASDTSAPPGPTFPVPANLWQPPAGSTPASGNFIYLQSDPADPTYGGQNVIYTDSNASISIANFLYSVDNGYANTPVNAPYIGISVVDQNGNTWTGDFETVYDLPLKPGYYDNAVLFPAVNPTSYALAWYGTSTCTSGALTGWFAIDNIVFNGQGALTALDLRFQQQCSGAAGALRGQIHWISP